MRAHGTRACYVVDRCRCPECREANRLYYRRRQEWVWGWEPEPMVSAGPTRRRLLDLRAGGIGLRTVAQATGLARSGLTLIITGHRTRVTVGTARIIRDTRFEPAGGTVLDAGPTLHRVEQLRARGLPRYRLAQRLNPNARALQIARTGRVLHRSATQVEAVWRSEAGLRCDLCGLPLSGHGLAGCPSMLRKRSA